MTTKKNKSKITIIGGAGHIGLPLGVAFAVKGIPVTLLDVNKAGLDQIASGVFPFKEEGGEEGLKKALSAKMLSVTTAPETISESDIIFLVLGTPVDGYLNPDFHGIMRLIEKYFDYFRDGQTLILRSTVYPGTTERLRLFFKKKGKNVRISFCPERIVQGLALKELETIPQIISAFEEETFKKVEALFKKINSEKCIRLNPTEAELAKLFSNAWRYIQFAVANQFFMIAEDRGLDYQAIYRGMTQNYPRMAGLPSPGFAAGPCLLKDTMQLSAFSKNTFFMGHAAMLINEGLPGFIVHRLKNDIPDLHEKTVGILGMAFKSENDDPRDSLSYKLRKIMRVHAAGVLAHDHYVEDETLIELNHLLDNSHVIILATPHKLYKKINPAKHPDKVFVDIWNFWGRGNILNLNS